jgi:hypothetical protein
MRLPLTPLAIVLALILGCSSPLKAESLALTESDVAVDLLLRELEGIDKGFAPMSATADSREVGCGVLGQLWCSGTCKEVRQKLGDRIGPPFGDKNRCVLITGKCGRFITCNCDIFGDDRTEEFVPCDPSKPWPGAPKD